MATIKLLTDWSEVNLATYMKVSEVQTSEDFENLNLRKAVEVIAALSDKTIDEVMTFDQSMLGDCLNKIAFINEDEIEDKSNEPFEINGVYYMTHPNFDQLTTGEMISIEQLILNAGENGTNYLDELLAILIRPCTKEGDTWKIDDFKAEHVEMRRQLFLNYLFVPFFLNRLMDFFDGSSLFERISALSSGEVKGIKERLKKLVN